jgi:hypothetical protein
MKITASIIALLAFALVPTVNVYSETVHQTVRGEAASAPDGGSALDKKLIEIKSIPNAGNVAHIVGTMSQWGFVNFWFGIPAPAGKVVIRFHIYVDDTPTSDYGVYVRLKSDAVFLAKLVVPADAPKNAFVDVDVPATETEDWSGLSLKKIQNSSKPSPWIDSVSIVLP